MIMNNKKVSEDKSGKILSFTLLFLFCIFLFVILIIALDNNKLDNSNIDDELYDITDSYEYDKGDNNDAIVSKDTFARKLNNYVEENLVSDEYDIYTKVVNGDDSSLNFTFKVVKSKSEYATIAYEIYNKIKVFLKLIYISDADVFDSNSVIINFYINKEVLNSLSNRGKFDDESYYVKIPYEIGGCSIYSNSGMFVEDVFTETAESLITFTGYIE